MTSCAPPHIFRVSLYKKMARRGGFSGDMMACCAICQYVVYFITIGLVFANKGVF
jgi:hypothetical protein